MKYSILMSFTLTMFTFVASVNAKPVTPDLAPGIPTSSEEARLQGISAEAYANFIDAKNNCDAYHSDDEIGWRNCIAVAENKLRAESATAGAPAVGQSIPVSTNSSNSNYEQMDPSEHKGFRNADE